MVMAATVPAQTEINPGDRTLEPGSYFHVCDWGRPSNSVSRVMSLCVQFIDGLEVTRDNIEGRLPSLIKGAGFDDVSLLGRVETILGTLDFISAKKTMI